MKFSKLFKEPKVSPLDVQFSRMECYQTIYFQSTEEVLPPEQPKGIPLVTRAVEAVTTAAHIIKEQLQ